MGRRYFVVSLSAFWRIALGGILALALVAGMLPPWSSPLQASAETASSAPDVAPVLLPATDKQGVMTLWQKGGTVTKATAREALLGDDAQLKEFIDAGQYESLKQDYRTTVIQISLLARSTTRAAAEDVLADGSWQELQKFVSEGWKASWLIDDRKDTYTAIREGTPAVKAAAQDAVASGDVAVQNFMISGKTFAENADKRKAVYRLINSSPSVKLAANEVLRVNTPEAIDDFLRYGQYVAAARDAETATVTQLANQAKSASDQAVEFNKKAITATEQAVSASKLAKEAAQRAASEAAAAKDSALRAGAAASRAASLADQAARAAQVAVGAAQEARSALSQAVRAATNAAAAAARAEQAAANAQGAAAAAANDGSQANAAKLAAQNARDAAAGASKAAEAAGFAAESTKQSISASDAALSAGRNAAAAASSAAFAAEQSGVSGYEAGLARAAANRANAAANRAEQASAQVNSLARQTFDTAEIARTAAVEAATRANSAANSADEAARQAGNSANAAKRAQDYADASKLAAEASAAAVVKAKTVQELARKADAERLTAERDFNLAQAREDKKVAEARQQRQDEATAAAQAAAATTSNLLAKLTAPGSDLNAQLPEVKAAVIGVAETGGPWQRAAASFAVVSGSEAMKEFIVNGLKTAREQDQWDDVYPYFDVQNKNSLEIQEAAQVAMYSGPETINNFLDEGRWKLNEAIDKKAVYSFIGSGGPEVKKAAQEALNMGTVQALREFLDRGQAAAKRVDDRKAVLALLSPSSTAGPEVKVAAQVAFEGPYSAVTSFLSTGQAEATKRDLEASAHDAMINSLIKKAESDSGVAKANAASAAQSAALARKVADEAQRWADEAKRSAAEAKVSADQAADFATQAKQSTDRAAGSAKLASEAAAQARSDAREAVSQAVNAASSAASSRRSAVEAADAARSAEASALQAGKDAQDAAAAMTEAWSIVADKKQAEDRLLLGNRPAGLEAPTDDAVTAAAGNNPEDAKELQDARDIVAAGDTWKIIADESGNALLEIIGVKDIERCLGGDFGSCIWAALGLVPWAKLGKVVGAAVSLIAKAPKIAERVSKFNDAVKITNRWKTEAGPGANPRPNLCRAPLASGGVGGGFSAGAGATSVIVIKTLPMSGPCGVPTPSSTFRDPKLLEQHWVKHKKDFNFSTKAEYEEAASKFLNSPRDGSGVFQVIRKDSSDIIRFNPKTNEFGILSNDKFVRTYYKPDPAEHGFATNMEYFLNQMFAR